MNQHCLWAITAILASTPTLAFGAEECIPVFTRVADEDSPFQGVDLTGGNIDKLRLADIDNDGDLDAFLTDGYSTTAQLENQGNATAGNFVVVPEHEKYFVGASAEYPPAFGDFDNDGDLDAVLYHEYYENEGTASIPQFTKQPIAGHPMEAVTLEVMPSFGDLDGDGDLDTIDHENIGTREVPSFVAQPIEFPLISGVMTGGTALADLDGDGDLDCVRSMGYSTYDAQIETRYFKGIYAYLYMNHGTAQDPLFDELITTSVTNPNIGFYWKPSVADLADIDADGDFELLHANYNGTVTVYESVMDCAAPSARCAAPFISLDFNGNFQIDPSMVDAGSSDDVGIAQSEVEYDTSGNPGCRGMEIVEVTLIVRDFAGKESTCIAEVTTVDDMAPILDLLGPPIQTTSCGVPYFDDGAISYDSCGGEIVLQVMGSVDYMTPGEYVIEYQTTDVLGNSRTGLRNVTVLADCVEPEDVSPDWGDVLREFHVLDTSGDGLLNTIEVSEAYPGLPKLTAVFSALDRNSNDVLSVAELIRFVGDDVIISADTNADYVISLDELLRIIQFFNAGGYHCTRFPEDTDDGFDTGLHTSLVVPCDFHSLDSNADHVFSLGELLRGVQLFNLGGYSLCEDGEDGFCGPKV